MVEKGHTACFHLPNAYLKHILSIRLPPYDFQRFFVLLASSSIATRCMFEWHLVSLAVKLVLIYFLYFRQIKQSRCVLILSYLNGLFFLSVTVYFLSIFVYLEFDD